MTTETAHYDQLSCWGNAVDDANQARIAQTIGLIPEDVRTILDVGCGDGKISLPLINQGYHVTGIDISLTALLQSQGNRMIANIDRIPFGDKSFDLVISAEVIEHLPYPIYRQALAEIERIARKYIVISTPNQEYLPAGFEKCEACLGIYHRNHHMRSLGASDHRQLFGEFSTVKSISIDQWKQVPWVIWIQHNLFGSYFHVRDGACPICGSALKKTTLSRNQRIGRKILDLATRYIPGYSKARWIASLYQSNN
jgi:SAM-dependent methyltransferase